MNRLLLFNLPLTIFLERMISRSTLIMFGTFWLLMLLTISLCADVSHQLLCDQPSTEKQLSTLKIIRQGENWKAVDTNRINVIPGSALDFSALTGSRKPAGISGRVIVNASGRLAFADQPDKPMRFFGINDGFITTRIAGISKEQLKEYAENLANQGYNVVRLQYLDAAMRGGSNPKNKVKDFDLALEENDFVFDVECSDKIDYLFYCLKNNGIYYNIDLMNRNYIPSIYWSKDKSQWLGGFHSQLMVSDLHRRHWERAITMLMNRRNPYTGLCLKDDPALLCVEPLNEQDLRLAVKDRVKALTPAFINYLRNKYKNAAALSRAWGKNIDFDEIPDINEDMLRKGDCIANDTGHFLIQLMTETTDWYFKTLRAAGYCGLISQWDMIMRTMEIPVRAKMPMIAQHSYFAHPNKHKTKNLVKKSPLNRNCYGNETGFFGYDTFCDQNSSLNSSYFRAGAAVRFLDRPFMMTEYSQSFFNRYRHERGLYFGAYAALQGWDALNCHATGIKRELPLIYFENQRDPISRASEAVIALTWLRGDVETARHCVQMNLSDKILFPKYFLSAIGDDYAKLAMLTKLGICYPEVKPLEPVGKVKADLEFSPTEFSSLSVKMWYATASNRDGTIFPALVKKLRGKGILPDSNQTDYSKRIYQSETGEITLNGKAATMSAITPRLEGAVIKHDRPVKLHNMNIISCSRPAAVTIASLDKQKNIPESRHLLLVFATDALNDGMIFENDSRQLMLEVGHLPILLETANLSLQLKTNYKGNGAVKVFPLRLDGSRMEPLVTAVSNGLLNIDLNTSALPEGAVFFEIVFSELK